LFNEKNEAVSPVIGTIFLVALTVVIIGIVGAAMMAYGMPEPAPILGISIGSQGNIITVTHLNGAELPAGSYKILVDGVDKTAAFGGTVDFGPGITLSWDSGSEAVGTVSIVYTSDKGVSTLLAEKRIGKAGGGGNIKILEIGGNTFDLSNEWGDEWTNIVAQAKNLTYPEASILINPYKVYYDGGDYWWVRNSGLRLTKAEADLDPSLDTFTSTHSNDLVKIKQDRLLTYDDTEFAWVGTVQFLDVVKPVNTGTLFTNEPILYVWASNDDADYFGPGYLGVWQWADIGNKV
jgi:porphobilinogen synthase